MRLVIWDAFALIMTSPQCSVHHFLFKNYHFVQTSVHWVIYGHYCDIIMSAMASPIISLTIVNSTVYSSTDERKYRSPASLAFVRGIHRWTVNSPHKGPVTRKLFPFDDVIMKKEWVEFDWQLDQTLKYMTEVINWCPAMVDWFAFMVAFIVFTYSHPSIQRLATRRGSSISIIKGITFGECVHYKLESMTPSTEQCIWIEFMINMHTHTYLFMYRYLCIYTHIELALREASYRIDGWQFITHSARDHGERTSQLHCKN